MRSNAQRYFGDFALTPTTDGFSSEIPAGAMVIRYSATVKGGAWREIGDRVLPGKDPIRFFEMTVRRVGDTTWPAAGAISPK
jgi:hypothetical protein